MKTKPMSVDQTIPAGEWEKEFDNELVDWNSPRFFADGVRTDTVKEFIRKHIVSVRSSTLTEVEGEIKNTRRVQKVITETCIECRQSMGCIRCQGVGHNNAYKAVLTRIKQMKEGK